MEQSQVISTIYQRLESDNVLAHCFGPKYNLVTITPGSPEVYISTITSTLSLNDYACIKADMGPYKRF